MKKFPKPEHKEFIRKNILFVFAAIILLIIFLILFFINNPQFVQTENGFELTEGSIISQYGLLGLLIGEALANATVFLPMPFDIIIVIVGSAPSLLGLENTLLSILAIGLFAGIGSAFGESTSYILGATGVESVKKLSRKEFRRLAEFKKKINKSGMIVIFLASFTPFPFDVVGIAAGMIKYNFSRFFAAMLLGKIIRCLLLAAAGFYGGSLLAIVSSIFLGTVI